MRLFIFEYIDQVSYNYHSGGGLAIVAKDEKQAKEMIEKEEFINITEKEWGEVKTYLLAEDYPARIYTFPDAGCC